MRRNCKPCSQLAFLPFAQLASLIFFSSQTEGSTENRVGFRACKRIDGRELVGKAAVKFKTPTIITHIIDEILPAAGALWQETPLRKKIAKQTITCDDVGGTSCYDYDANVVIPYEKPIKLNKVLNLLKPNGINGDMPGNLFIYERHPLVKKLVSSVVNDSSNTPILTKALESLSKPRETALSLGREAQWNNLHRHGENLFIQMSGRKGWVMFPSKGIPKKYIKSSDRSLIDEDMQQGIFDQLSMCRYLMCERLADMIHENRGEMCRREAIEEYTRNNSVSRYKGFACDVKEGEALFIPYYWWHGTCNLDPWNAGFALISRLRHQEL